MTILVNLTPHTVIVRTDVTDITIFPVYPVLPPARIVTTTVADGSVAGIPLVRQEFGAIENLPEPIDGVVYITSTMVAQRAARSDVVSPDTGPTAIRENGQIVAVRNLQVFA